MEVIFIGVGEACDPSYANTSILIRSADSTSHLLDCGFSVPHYYFSHCADPDELDTLWISHFHGDHFCGVPLLLLRFREMGRQKPLWIVGQEGIAEKIRAAAELAYADMLAKLPYRLNFQVIEPDKKITLAGQRWQAARADHSRPCLALRLSDGENVIFYSGDGRPTPETTLLAHGCDLLIHEAFMLTDEIPGHGSVEGCREFFRRTAAKRLALVHINGEIRFKEKKRILRLLAELPGKGGFLPETGEKIIL